MLRARVLLISNQLSQWEEFSSLLREAALSINSLSVDQRSRMSQITHPCDVVVCDIAGDDIFCERVI
jgi:hypothetical protein